MHFKLLKNKEKTVLKNQKKQEKSRGRSMVEMLGVLAIIGVLSIGGIQGYTLAMRKYRANEILNYLQKASFLAYTQFEQRIENSPDDVYISTNDGEGQALTAFLDATYKCKDAFGNFSNSNCLKGISITNLGLGGLPSGIKEVELGEIFTTQNDDIVVSVRGLFNEGYEELCKQVLASIPNSLQSDGADHKEYPCPKFFTAFIVDAE